MANKTISSNNDNSLREFNNRNKKSNKHNKNKNKNSRHNKNNNVNNNNKNSNNNNSNNNNSNNNNSNNYYDDNYKPRKIPTYNIKIGEGDFCLSSESLNRDAPNFFTAAFFGYFSESKTTSIFIERDPIYFSMIVRYLRGYEVDWPINDKISMNNLLADVKYYGFGRLQNLLEESYEEHFPENVIPWKILTYASESDPVVVMNIKDVELERWNSHSLIYDTNPILENKKSLEIDGRDGDNSNDDADDNSNDNDDDNSNDNDDDNSNDNASINTLIGNDDNVTNNDATANAAIDNNNENNDQNNADNIIEPNPDKGLYRLEIHGSDALANVTSNNNNGVKFENFTLKNSEQDMIFRKVTESFRTAEGSLTLTPSLKLPFLKDACVEIDGIKYYNYNDLSTYFGVTTKRKPLYFEEIVIRIDDSALLMRARAWTAPFYYASQPFVHSVRSRKT